MKKRMQPDSWLTGIKPGKGMDRNSQIWKAIVKKVSRWMVILSLVFFPLVSLNAQLYSWTDESGVMHFSDTQPTAVSNDDIKELAEDEYYVNKEIKYTYSRCRIGGACMGSPYKCKSDILISIDTNSSWELSPHLHAIQSVLK